MGRRQRPDRIDLDAPIIDPPAGAHYPQSREGNDLARDRKRPERVATRQSGLRRVGCPAEVQPEPSAPVTPPALQQQIEQLTRAVERWNIGDYVALMHQPWKLMGYNFVAGVARGVGIAFGFTVVTAIILKVLSSALVSNIPVLGQFIAEIVSLVRMNLRP